MSARAEYEALRRRREEIAAQDALYEARLLALRAESAARIAAVMAEADRIIATSRPTIRPMLRATVDECQADYDEERDHGWAA